MSHHYATAANHESYILASLDQIDAKAATVVVKHYDHDKRPLKRRKQSDIRDVVASRLAREVVPEQTRSSSHVDSSIPRVQRKARPEMDGLFSSEAEQSRIPSKKILPNLEKHDVCLGPRPSLERSGLSALLRF
jgi:hypothetical protein